MLNYYDHDSDGSLTENELDDIEHRDHLDKLNRYCSLTDMLTYDDQNEDDVIDNIEFFKAFSESCLLFVIVSRSATWLVCDSPEDGIFCLRAVSVSWIRETRFGFALGSLVISANENLHAFHLAQGVSVWWTEE